MSETPGELPEAPDVQGPTGGEPADAFVGGAAGAEEGAPIGFTADVGGEPGMTSDPDEARDASSGGEAGRHGTSEP